jgi:glycosyltransferase involved in cell wall biosynthesis
LFFGLLARVFGKKLVIVITDPPGVLQPADSKLAKILKRIDIWLVSFALARANAVVALAPELIECFAKNKPSLVFPGIVNSDLVEHLSKASPLDTSSREFTIVYAGGLSKAYGVDRLLSAIAMIKEKRVCLKLFGRGELEEKIKALAESLDCIQYGGFIGSDKLIPELCSADLLINPRPTQDAFAVMSFPSKLIEYLAIGSPVLTTRIASIPDSYKPYFFFIDDESEEGIRESILRVINMDFAYREKHALQGQEFIQTEASEMAVGNKIAGFIGSISLGDVNDQNKTR